VVRSIAVLFVASTSVSSLAAQAHQLRDTPARDVRQFIVAARAGTERYRDQETAIRDGFRRVGVSFPSMGEHWVSLQRIMANRFVAAEPSVLIYARVRAQPTLVGVAYTVLLDGRTHIPDFAPARSHWHEHNGSVEEESLPLRHVADLPAQEKEAPDAPRLAILHAWVWADNPAGTFVTDNWRLPLVRVRVEPPRDSPSQQSGDHRVAHAIALGLDGGDYLSLVLRHAAPLDARESEIATRVVAKHAATLAHLISDIPRAHRLTRGDRSRLEAVWNDLFAELRTALPQRADAISRLSEHFR
jgi:hypothetical protein